MAKDRLREIADRYWDEVTYFPWVIAVAFILATAIQRAL